MSHEVKYVFPSNNKALAHCLQNLKWPLGGPKMADGVWKGIYSQIFGAPVNFN